MFAPSLTLRVIFSCFLGSVSAFFDIFAWFLFRFRSVERFDDGVFAVEPAEEVDLAAALAAEWLVGTRRRGRREFLAANGTLRISDHCRTSGLPRIKRGPGYSDFPPELEPLDLGLSPPPEDGLSALADFLYESLR